MKKSKLSLIFFSILMVMCATNLFAQKILLWADGNSPALLLMLAIAITGPLVKMAVFLLPELLEPTQQDVPPV